MGGGSDVSGWGGGGQAECRRCRRSGEGRGLYRHKVDSGFRRNDDAVCWLKD